MTKKVISVLALVLLVILAVAVFSQMARPEAEAKAMLKQRLGNNVIVSVEPLRNKGVACGSFGRSDNNSRSVPLQRFVYVSHYSAQAPEHATLVLEGDKEFRKYSAFCG